MLLLPLPRTQSNKSIEKASYTPLSFFQPKKSHQKSSIMPATTTTTTATPGTTVGGTNNGNGGAATTTRGGGTGTGTTGQNSGWIIFGGRVSRN